ncbi:hypothetical protein PAESOLCIP111_01704 [Paenibacillus solanacearum]|uniref:Phage tail collar domain-containing protein n=1 Tax=Paenibacillus solanacearum TaxID=2048548 RepID=A0A916JZB8_9BACL|nr:tail fiber protein [Paenibacillus solanacearum]CAG7614392.1 hypothetical protein PAESOLCIP111_01704 [Paenibacillus solanacearum]
MAEPFLAEIRLFSFNFPPKGWAQCSGQLLPIAQNQALFSLLGSTYGGDGRTNFALPDLRGRAPVHWGQGISLGEKAGEEAHTLNISEMPAHTHAVKAGGSIAAAKTVSGQTWATTAASSYNTQSALVPGDSAFHSSAISQVGGSQPHGNLQPYVTVNFCIALIGIFPSQT